MKEQAIQQATQQNPEINETYSSPQVDIYETEQQLVLMADMPGVTAEQLTIDVEKGLLTLDGWVERQGAQGEDAVQRHHYRRRFQIGRQFDPQQAAATLEAGVLTLTLPRLQASLPQRIEVKAA
jgi:HSP20 family molecular chaperone IbpA